ncbi:MAG: HU family DNA-binding protein, partial [Acidimicrobiales bacterium]
MNRSELVNHVASTVGLDKRQAEAAVMAFIDSVVGEAKSGNKVSIFGFGTFAPAQRDARVGRNPRTGDSVRIPARTVVRFKPATAFNEALNTKATKRSAANRATAAKSAPARAAAAKTTKTTKAANSPPAKAAQPAKAPGSPRAQAAQAAQAPAAQPAKAPGSPRAQAAQAAQA